MFTWLRNVFKPPRRDEAVDGITREEMMRRADDLARRAGLSDAAEAFRRLDAGDLEGTLIEAELRALRYLASVKSDDRELSTA